MGCTRTITKFLLRSSSTLAVVLFIPVALLMVAVPAWSSTHHTVQTGDTLWQISQKYNVPLDKIYLWNDLCEQSLLRVGMKILVCEETVPASSSYIIQPGDNLWDISRAHGVSLEALCSANNISQNTVLRVGQKLSIPSGSTASGSGGGTGVSSSTIHTVDKGESLWLISRFYGVTLSSIVEANNLHENSILQVGMKLTIPTSSSSPSMQASVSQSSQGDGSDSEGFYYSVCAGDTLWALSRQYGVSVNSLMKANNLNSSSRLQVNQRLYIPGREGQAQASASSPGTEYETYQVRPGDSLWSISRHYRVSLDQLISLNGLSQSSVLRVGQTIRIPAYISGDYGIRSEGMVWPLSGRVSSPYGNRAGGFHTGIDIAAPAGTPIRAAKSGVVSFSGWLNGYGRTVIIDHPDGLQTLYAHNQVNLVSRGQRVNQGDLVARVGISGNATGYHCHFEIRQSGRHTNPMQFLRR